MSQSTCPLCGGCRDSPPLELHHSRYQFCPVCLSFQRLAGISDDVQSHDFRLTYGAKRMIQNAAQDRHALWTEVMGHLSILKDSHEKPRLLDVGCGYGDFLISAQGTGWSVSGIEINPTMQDACRKKGIEVLTKPLRDLTPPFVKFHTVTYLNVLDSIPDPLEEVRLASQWICPGGRILIRIPNGALHGMTIWHLPRVPLLWSRYLKLEATPLNAWIFHPVGIRSLLESAGFSKIKVYRSVPVSGSPFTRRVVRIIESFGRILSGTHPLSTSVIVEGEWTPPDTVPNT